MVDDLKNGSGNHWPFGAPIIVCGRPRSGTTFIRGLLNAHEDIYIGRELRQDFYDHALRLFDLTQGIFKREQWRAMMPQFAEARLMYNLLFFAEPQAHSARRIGNKTPGNEWRLATFERVFSVQLPVYIYVLRRGVDQITSVRNQAWGMSRSVATLTRDYCSSVAQFEKMKSRFPDRVHLVQPDLVQTIQARTRLVEQLFAAIGETADAGVEGYSRAWRKMNESGSGKLTPLKPVEADLLAEHEQFSLIQQRFGYGASA